MRKFGFVMTKVLFPMALDYHIRSRAHDVDAVAAAEVANLNAGATAFNAAVQVRAALPTTYIESGWNIHCYEKLDHWKTNFQSFVCIKRTRPLHRGVRLTQVEPSHGVSAYYKSDCIFRFSIISNTE